MADLRKQAAAEGIAAPGKRVAILHLDGDRMGKLLAGDADAIGARWRDVLHPETLRRLERNEYLGKAGWADLVHQKRLMGPSLHAFISRALGTFSHHIVPWVVEQEFSGRLIYAGGDDVVAMVPASEAVDLAARLQQLFSAAWVVDTQPEVQPWSWRFPGAAASYSQPKARDRFVIPLPPGWDGKEPIRLNHPDQRVATHAGGKVDEVVRAYDVGAVVGQLMPMLGTAASLSAGIAIAHYKTPLGGLVERSKDLEKMAKRQGRGALAVGHASRGGIKTGFSLPWKAAGQSVAAVPSAQIVLRRVVEGFGSGLLPGRLPYKLRDLAPSLGGALAALRGEADAGLFRRAVEQLLERDTAYQAANKDSEKVDLLAKEIERLLRGLFESCLERSQQTHDADEVIAAAFTVWKRGVLVTLPDGGKATSDCERKAAKLRAEQFTHGLLVCRELARGDADGEDEA
ncbi:type III-B CRISPR-associated protein Cas10/Cmr2 [Caenispirillum bisanense]|uniref:type III-B CRISPR-associated protein Cas10/Cmr2 n=1 Tax=Caenispirillum bisanense TaxID=414052 RepID=UPI0031E3D313